MSVEEFNKKLKEKLEEEYGKKFVSDKIIIESFDDDEEDSFQKENKLYQHLLESGEIKTDDPEEFDAWLERNEEDYRETDGTTAEEV